MCRNETRHNITHVYKNVLYGKKPCHSEVKSRQIEQIVKHLIFD